MTSFDFLPLGPYERKLKERYEARIQWNRNVAWFYSPFVFFQTLFFADLLDQLPTLFAVAVVLIGTSVVLAIGVLRKSGIASCLLLVHSLFFAGFCLHIAELGNWLLFQGGVIGTIGSLAWSHVELFLLKRSVLIRLKAETRSVTHD